MRFIYFVAIFQLFAFTCYAQNTPTSFGGTISDSDIEISFAMGEVVVANANQASPSIVSGVIQPFTNLSVPINEISSYSLNIFPNPTDSYLNIEQEETLFSEFEIYSINGKLLLQGQFVNQIENLENLTSGIYLLRLRNENQIFNSLFEKI